MVLNTGAATLVFRGGESHLDLAFSSPGVANMVSWEVLDYSCGSDHSLIQIELQPYIQYEEIYNSRWVFKRANWKTFSEECDANLKVIALNDDIDDINVEVAEAIFKAAEISIPRSTGNGKRKRAMFWNDECDKAVKDREKARRKIKMSRSLYDFVEFKRMKAVATKVINAAKRRG